MSHYDPLGYYRILGIEPNANAQEIKAAFRRRAMELHPDKNKNPNATSNFQFLNEAYSVLSDPISRARYDTSSIRTKPPEENSKSQKTAKENDERQKITPIFCSCCGKATAQPRYVIFHEIKSFIFVTTKKPIQGIFCSTCSAKKSLKATMVTWLFGWWGFPWGPIYSIPAIIRNLLGGKQSNSINARIAAHQAWAFAMLGNLDLARAVAFDAIDFAKKIKPDKSIAKFRQQRGYEVEDEGREILTSIDQLFSAIGGKNNAKRLKNSWAGINSFYKAQWAIVILIAGTIGWGIYSSNPSDLWNPPRESRPYVGSPSQAASRPWAQYSLSNQIDRTSAQQSQAPTRKPYIHPIVAPNGQPWPVSAGYISGYEIANKSGNSLVTIDNSRNNSDVFVKLVALNSENAIPVRNFYVPAYQKFTLSNVTAGTYDVRYRDLSTGGLFRTEKFTLTEIRDYRGIEYSTITMTLYKVLNGNMHTYQLAEDEF